MKTSLKLLFAIAALGLGAGAAQAQTAPPTPPPPPPGPGLTAENPAVRSPGDTYDREMALARDDAVAKKRGERGVKSKGPRAVPAKPDDVTVGSEVRDSKGVVVGMVESVSMSAAVIVSPGGKVEVPLEAFGKNSKGLLFSMTKEEFDKVVADASKPAG